MNCGKYLQTLILQIFATHLYLSFSFAAPCRFRGERTGEKVVRLSEATPIGTEAFRVLAFPRRNFNIQALDGVRNCIVCFFIIKGHRGTVADYRPSTV